jgi:hypothetical protein
VLAPVVPEANRLVFPAAQRMERVGQDRILANGRVDANRQPPKPPPLQPPLPSPAASASDAPFSRSERLSLQPCGFGMPRSSKPPAPGECRVPAPATVRPPVRRHRRKPPGRMTTLPGTPKPPPAGDEYQAGGALRHSRAAAERSDPSRTRGHTGRSSGRRPCSGASGWARWARIQPPRAPHGAARQRRLPSPASVRPQPRAIRPRQPDPSPVVCSARGPPRGLPRTDRPLHDSCFRSEQGE